MSRGLLKLVTARMISSWSSRVIPWVAGWFSTAALLSSAAEAQSRTIMATACARICNSRHHDAAFAQDVLARFNFEV
jgi:hypothetical protein